VGSIASPLFADVTSRIGSAEVFYGISRMAGHSAKFKLKEHRRPSRGMGGTLYDASIYFISSTDIDLHNVGNCAADACGCSAAHNNSYTNSYANVNATSHTQCSCANGSGSNFNTNYRTANDNCAR
jgi:hypothetical protein